MSKNKGNSLSAFSWTLFGGIMFTVLVGVIIGLVASQYLLGYATGEELAFCVIVGSFIVIDVLYHRARQRVVKHQVHAVQYTAQDTRVPAMRLGCDPDAGPRTSFLSYLEHCDESGSEQEFVRALNRAREKQEIRMSGVPLATRTAMMGEMAIHDTPVRVARDWFSDHHVTTCHKRGKLVLYRTYRLDEDGDPRFPMAPDEVRRAKPSQARKP